MLYLKLKLTQAKAFRGPSNYYELLNDNGIIFGDDFGSFEDVRRAVIQFSDRKNLKFEILNEKVWIIRKDDKQGFSLQRYLCRRGYRNIVKDITRITGFEIIKID